MPDPAIVQDGASSTGLGDAGKRVMEQYDIERQISKGEKAQSAAKKAGEAQIMSQYGSVLSKPYEEFKPSQETASGFAALGSLLMVAGGMMGGKGRLAGIGAMNNIAGMVKGYQQGRKDLYEQERTQFEENMKVFEKNRTLIKEAFDRALKMAPYNLTTAQNNLRKELSALGASIPAEMTAKSGLVQAAGQHDTFHTNTTSTLDQLREKLGRSRAEADAEAADKKSKEEALKQREQEAKTTLEEQKVAGGGKAAQITDDAANFIADSYLSNPQASTVLFSRLSVPDKDKVLSVISQKAKDQGVSGADLDKIRLKYAADTAAVRAFGTSEAKTSAAALTAANSINIAKDYSERLPRGTFQTFNSFVQKGLSEISDPDLLGFRKALDTLSIEYARATTPTGQPTDYKLKIAQNALSTVTSKEAFDEVIDVMEREIAASQKAQQQGLEAIIGAKSTPPATAPTSVTPSIKESKTLPPEAVSKLKEGVQTKFKNGETWTLTNGVPTQVQQVIYGW